MNRLLLASTLLLTGNAFAMGGEGMVGGIFSLIGWVMVGSVCAGLLAYVCVDWPKQLALSLLLFGLIISMLIGFFLMRFLGHYAYIASAILFLPIASAIFFIVMVLRVAFGKRKLEKGTLNPSDIRCRHCTRITPAQYQTCIWCHKQVAESMVVRDSP